MKRVENLYRDVAVVVVGAGAAGLAAANALATARVPFLVLEGRGRLGGRACTDTTNGLPLDLGCGWLHSANRNPWAAIAYKLGFHIDKTPPKWDQQAFDQGISETAQKEFQDAFEDFEKRIDQADLGTDQPAAAFLDPQSPWNAMMDAISTYLNGAHLRDVSAKDYQNYQDTDINWRIKEGFGALVGAYGAGMNVALRTRVLCIHHDGLRLRIETDRGDIHSDQAIITVPTAALAEESLRFKPELPDKIDAAVHLPLGLVNKLFLACDQPEMFPADGHLTGNWTTAATGSYHLRPFGHPVIEVFLAGELGRELARGGLSAHADFAINELVELLGTDVRKYLRPAVVSTWHDDLFARGSYSYAEVGHAGMRRVLAVPVDDRLFFAGEACSVNGFATAHGAFQSGTEAARQLVAARKVAGADRHTGAGLILDVP